MAKLLSDQDFADIRAAVNDVIETFAQLPIVYKKLRRRTLSRFNRESTTDQHFDSYNFNALEVWGNKGSDGTLQTDEKGKWDLSGGYLLMAFDDIKTANLIDASNNLLMEPEVDKVVIKGIEYEITGAMVAGQLKDKEVVVKIQFKKALKNG